jgi:hypothetical protein
MKDWNSTSQDELWWMIVDPVTALGYFACFRQQSKPRETMGLHFSPKPHRLMHMIPIPIVLSAQVTSTSLAAYSNAGALLRAEPRQ